MVLDYGILREQLKRLTDPLDHKVLLPTKVKELKIEEKECGIEIKSCQKRYLIPKEDVIFLPLSATTAEKLAQYFHSELKKIWPNFKIKVNIEEGPGASATYFD